MSKRIEQVIAWLQHAGRAAAALHHSLLLQRRSCRARNTGPDSPQTAAAVEHVDQLMGDLWTELAQLQLPVDLIVVSDHGMEREQGAWIDLDKYTDLANFITVGSLLYPNSEAAAEKAYQGLKIKSDAFTVYRRQRVPAALHYDSNPREGDPVMVANGPYAIRAHAPGSGAQDRPPGAGCARLRPARDEVHAGESLSPWARIFVPAPRSNPSRT